MPSGAFRALQPHHPRLILSPGANCSAASASTLPSRLWTAPNPPTLEDDPATYAMRAAQAKAEAVARAAGPETPDAVVLGSDTIVVLHEEHGPIILGKPASRDEALAMLLHLSGRTHTVYTGCCIIWLSASWGKPDGTVLRRRRRDLRGVARRRAPRLRGHRRMRRQGRLLRHTGPRLLPCLGNQRPMGDNRGPPRTCRGTKAYGWGKYRSSSLFGNKSFIEIEDTRAQTRVKCQDQSWTYPSPCLRLYFGLGGSVHHSSWHGNCPSHQVDGLSVIGMSNCSAQCHHFCL